MNSLDQLAQAMGVNVNDEPARLALRQIDNNSQMLSSLIKVRKAQFPVIEEFSAFTGIEVQALLSFENDPLDFTLAFVRLYALGIGEEITHHISSRTFPTTAGN